MMVRGRPVDPQLLEYSYDTDMGRAYPPGTQRSSWRRPPSSAPVSPSEDEFVHSRAAGYPLSI